MNSFLTELKRRNIFRVASVYAIVGWLLIQLGIALETTLNLPSWFDTFVTILVLFGFPIAMVLAWAYEMTADGVKPTEKVKPHESIRAKTGRKLSYAIIAGSIVVVGVLAVQTFKTVSTPFGTAANHLTDASIAVLPFDDLSSDQSQEYFGDGVAEELINVLAKIDAMKVAGRTSSFAFKGQQQDLREIGRILNVANILEGSIRKSGDKIRVTAQLIKVDDGFHLWSETYDRDLSDIFAVQDDISQKISSALMPHLMGEQAPAIQDVARTDVKAYSKFFEARELVRTRNLSGFQRAQSLLNDVIKTDPEYARAYALQAQVTLFLSDRQGAYGTVPIAEAVPAAQAHIDKALSIDPSNGDGYAAKGLAYSMSDNPDKAIPALRRAVELSPNNLDANMWLAIELQRDRRHLDTVEAFAKIFDQDPLFGPIGSNLVLHLERTGQWKRAEKVVERLENIAPDAETTKLARAQYLSQQGWIGAATQITKGIYENNPNVRNVGLVTTPLFFLGAFDEMRSYKPSPIYEVWATILEGDSQAGVLDMKAMLDASPESGFMRNEYIMALSENEQDAEVAAYFSKIWKDIRSFEADTYSPFSEIPPRYGVLARAFQELEKQDLLSETLQRWRTSIDLDHAGGKIDLYEQEALWQVLSGNNDAAIAQLEAGFDTGFKIYEPWWLNGRLFEPLQDNPKFKAFKAKNLVRINEERAILGLDPLTG